MVPTQERPDEADITWIFAGINSSDKESLPEKVSKRLLADEQLIIKWSSARLQMELERLLWKDVPHLSICKLWGYFCTYLYLPRLAKEDVLLNAISSGLVGKDYFGYADRLNEDGRYLGLVFGTGRSTINDDGESLLVKPDVAQAQIDEDAKARAVREGKAQDDRSLWRLRLIFRAERVKGPLEPYLKTAGPLSSSNLALRKNKRSLHPGN